MQLFPMPAPRNPTSGTRLYLLYGKKMFCSQINLESIALNEIVEFLRIVKMLIWMSLLQGNMISNISSLYTLCSHIQGPICHGTHFGKCYSDSVTTGPYWRVKLRSSLAVQESRYRGWLIKGKVGKSLVKRTGTEMKSLTKSKNEDSSKVRDSY